MELNGERVLPVDRATAWAALNDVDVLKAAVPGCESITLTAPDAYDVRVNAAIGPVKTRFTGKLALADVQPPESYTLRFEMQGGAAGFARGDARVRLESVDAQATKMSYGVNASIGGKLAQIGSRLVDAAAATMADKFFANFAAEIANRHPAPALADRAITCATAHVTPSLRTGVSEIATAWPGHRADAARLPQSMKLSAEQESAPPEAASSAWEPLRRPVFRLLWGTWMTANICMWMNEVASAWLMTSLTTSPVMVALVQSASVLPVVLFGLPSGALADILNRRRWFMFTQFWVAANALILCVVLAAGWMTAPVLLALTFGNGIGLAMRWPVYAAIVPELVTRRELPAAIALNGIAMNMSRIIGPVIAGALIASLGTGYVFLLNAALSLAAGFVIMRWRMEPKASVLPGERFIGAMRVGFQYVAQSRLMRSVLLRIAIFFLQSTALLALLPLVAKRMPAGNAWTYTFLLASLGVGAIATAFFLPRLRVLITRDRLLRDGTLLQAFAMVAVGFAPNVWVAIPPMMLAGAAWLAVVNTLTVQSQLALPDWVRARGMSLYMMTMMAATSGSAAVWGQVASMIDVPLTLVASAATGLTLWLLVARRQVAAGEQQDLTPARILKEPVPAFPVEHQMGPVMVTVDYQIDPVRAAEFTTVMRESRANRLQMGALSWGLFQDTSETGHYIEYYLDESWADHLRRFDRFTAADAELRERRYAFHVGAAPPKVTRYIAESLGE